MLSDAWKRIADHYKKAKICLWCPSGESGWHRQEDKGRYHLWQAYYEARYSWQKEDYLLYARILVMMSHEQKQICEYDQFHKFIAPAKEAYDNALAAGMTPDEEELKEINHSFDSLQYVLKMQEDTDERSDAAYSCIEGLNDIEDFCFHDSKPVHFEHQDNQALLKLDYYGVCVTFKFTGLLDIEVDGDPTTNWIIDFYCYPLFGNPNFYYFDVGYYRITCEHIQVIDVKRDSPETKDEQ